jgi:hypothetical protein
MYAAENPKDAYEAVRGAASEAYLKFSDRFLSGEDKELARLAKELEVDI